MMGVNPQITNLGIILFMMQASKKINFEDPQILMLIRVVYVLSNLIIVAIYLIDRYNINKKKDRTTLKYVEPPAMGSADDGKLVTTTIHAYDLSQLRGAFKSQLMGIGMMGVMHLYFKFTNPLLIQSIIPLKGALESNLTKIHLYRMPEIARPFKATGGIPGLTPAEPKTDKKSIEAAERRARGGVKDE